MVGPTVVAIGAPGLEQGAGTGLVPQPSFRQITDTVREHSDGIGLRTFPEVQTLEERNWWATTQVASIILCGVKAEQAAATGDEQRMFETAEELRALTAAYAAGLRAFDVDRE